MPQQKPQRAIVGFGKRSAPVPFPLGASIIKTVQQNAELHMAIHTRPSDVNGFNCSRYTHTQMVSCSTLSQGDGNV